MIVGDHEFCHDQSVGEHKHNDRLEELEGQDAAGEPFDAVVQRDGGVIWLLRTGIDHTGTLDINVLWDIAIRAAVLVDLTVGPAQFWWDDDGVHVQPTGVDYLERAITELRGFPDDIERSFLTSGELRARDVAEHLLESGEWSRHLSFLWGSLHIYKAAVQHYIPERRRLAHVLDGDVLTGVEQEVAIARLGHALNVVRPTKLFKQPKSLPHAGSVEPIIVAAEVEIAATAAEAREAAQNPTW